jgi:hypothetical protein
MPKIFLRVILVFYSKYTILIIKIFNNLIIFIYKFINLTCQNFIKNA